MNVSTILNKTISLVTPNMHKKRQASLCASVQSLVLGSSATVTCIGRGINTAAKEKHNIKRADRLLSNVNIQHELNDIYKALSSYTVGHSQRPIVLIDWSDLDEYKRHFLLRASLAAHGRSLCIYEEIHTVKTKEKPATHKAFLNKLAQILPDKCNPIIVTDAGFKSPWFRSVQAIGWDFVGRVRLPNHYDNNDGQWRTIKHAYASATTCPKSFEGRINRSNPLSCRLVLFKGKAKGRVALNRQGQPRRSKKVKTHIKSARDPWLIATSLTHGHQLAKRVVKIYRMRMQIEEGFRDMKSHRFGQGFEYNQTRKTERLKVLILLTTLAHWLFMILGMSAKMNGSHRQYQANSVKHTNVLSLHFIGQRVALNNSITLKLKSCLIAMRQLSKLSEGLSYDSL